MRARGTSNAVAHRTDSLHASARTVFCCLGHGFIARKINRNDRGNANVSVPGVQCTSILLGLTRTLGRRNGVSRTIAIIGRMHTHTNTRLLGSGIPAAIVNRTSVHRHVQGRQC